MRVEVCLRGYLRACSHVPHGAHGQQRPRCALTPHVVTGDVGLLRRARTFAHTLQPHHPSRQASQRHPHRTQYEGSQVRKPSSRPALSPTPPARLAPAHSATPARRARQHQLLCSRTALPPHARHRRRSAAREHEHKYFHLVVPPTVYYLKVVVVPIDGDPDIFLSFDNPLPSALNATFTQVMTPRSDAQL